MIYLLSDKNKDIDVFILYEMKEINFVTGYLIPTLVNTYDYVVSSHVLQNNVDGRCPLSMSKVIFV